MLHTNDRRNSSCDLFRAIKKAVFEQINAVEGSTETMPQMLDVLTISSMIYHHKSMKMY